MIWRPFPNEHPAQPPPRPSCSPHAQSPVRSWKRHIHQVSLRMPSSLWPPMTYARGEKALIAAGTSNTTWCPARPTQAAGEVKLVFHTDISVSPLPRPRRYYRRRPLLVLWSCLMFVALCKVVRSRFLKFIGAYVLRFRSSGPYQYSALLSAGCLHRLRTPSKYSQQSEGVNQ